MDTLEEIIRNPITKERMSFVSNNEIINSDSEIEFKLFKKGRLFKVLPNLKKKKVDNLNGFDNSINYLEHYQKDALVFDYFEEIKDNITVDENNRLHQKIINEIPNNIETILDVGCGNGWLAKNIINEKNKVISMDISDINPIKALSETNHINHFGLIADINYLPLKLESIDCIVASEIFEHLNSPEIVFENLFHLIKKGGRIIITSPFNEKIRHHLCIHCNNKTPENAHLHSFNLTSIKQIIPKDAKIVKIESFVNLYMVKLRIYWFMRFIPFNLWNLIDKMINKVLNRQVRLLLVIEK